jgi:hypothetical protein
VKPFNQSIHVLYTRIELLSTKTQIGLTGHSHHKSPGLSCYTVHNIYSYGKALDLTLDSFRYPMLAGP